MLRESHTAIVVRNEVFAGDCASEPYEAAWAKEAIIWVRALAIKGKPAGVFKVQISPDGMRWVDEGAKIKIPTKTETVEWVRVRHFGNWLRIVGKLPRGVEIKPLVTITLKG